MTKGGALDEQVNGVIHVSDESGEVNVEGAIVAKEATAQHTTMGS